MIVNALHSSFLQLLLEVGFPKDFNTINYRPYIYIYININNSREKASNPSG